MDEDSVTQLIGQHYPGLLLLIRRRIRDDQLAADVLNQAVVTSLEHVSAGRIREPSLIAGYVFEVAMNHLRNHRRKYFERAQLRVGEEVIHGIATSDDPPGVPIDTTIFANRVRQLIGDLPTPRDREIVKRFYLDEDEKEVICRDLGLSPLHFDKVIFRARQRMKSLLEAKGFKRSDFFSVLAFCFA